MFFYAVSVDLLASRSDFQGIINMPLNWYTCLQNDLALVIFSVTGTLLRSLQTNMAFS